MAFDTIRYRIKKFFEGIEFQFFKLRPYFVRPFNKGFLPERDGHKIFYQQYVTHHFLIFSLSQEPHKKSAQGN